MDDVGIDQLQAFNPLARVRTPNIDTLVAHGVRFTSNWMMPECSPSRAAFFTGRYPLRTGVEAAILSYGLPSSQVSPYEVTTPQVLAHAGYISALIGKFHLGGPDNNPAGFRTPSVLGWDYYNGNLQGGPPFIDPTLGGQIADTTRYPCGFPLGEQRGVCWFYGPGNQIRCDDNHGAGYTGHDCVTLGGIPALDASGDFASTCAEATIQPAFTNYNGYYVWPQVINDRGRLQQSTVRQYMSVFNTDTAIDWLQKHPRGQGKNARPWMCAVSYDSIHTPYQQPPTNLYPPGFSWPPEIGEGCTNEAQLKILGDLMLYALDQEIGRLLVGAGLAQRLPSGQLDYRPEATDTMVILVGDNGTYLSGVNAPYDPLRSKGTTYQTGVTTPLVISGPLVKQPGRMVGAMVNAVDLFQLFGEIAGLDVRALVPSSHILDCHPMLAYLTNPAQRPIRHFNFTQIGQANKSPKVQTYACILSIGPIKIGTDVLFNSQLLCNDDGGQWFGPSPTNQFTTCCEVRSNVYPNLVIIPARSWAIRNERFKLVKSERASCDSSENPFEFYDLQPTLLNPVGLDLAINNRLSTNAPPLSLLEAANLLELQDALNIVLNSEPLCYGDGNLDKVVDQQDLDGVLRYWGQPSVFDVNNDGTTDQKDLDCVLQNFGHNCLMNGSGQPCNN
jgi:arylsulfatase A-like enzyme